MISKRASYALVLVSGAVAVGGLLALWSAYPSILGKLGGFNIASFGVMIFLTALVVLISVDVLRYAQGKPLHRWRLEIAMTFALLASGIGLALAYDYLLPSSVPIPWRYFILPYGTLVIAFYVLRRIPKVRKIIDEMFRD